MGQELVPSLLGRCKQKQRGLRGNYVTGPPLLNGRCTSLLRAPVSEMTYTVLSGTLNPSISYHTCRSVILAYEVISHNCLRNPTYISAFCTVVFVFNNKKIVSLLAVTMYSSLCVILTPLTNLSGNICQLMVSLYLFTRWLCCCSALTASDINDNKLCGRPPQ